MARKLYDVVVKAGTQPNGKAIWKNVGAMVEGSRGPFILLDRTFNPAGVNSDSASIILSLFEPKNDESSRGGGGDGFTDDKIPF